MQSKDFLTPLLIPVSGLYRLALAFDRWFTSKHAVRLPKPVISIGNLTWGGTGKTPLLLKLLSDLLANGFHPSVLTRGYRGVGRSLTGTVHNQSDEVALMARRFPGVPLGVGKDRVNSAAQLMVSYPIDAFVLDDGFQHWKIPKDLDIVCVDATDPWGNGHLIPWGKLREPKERLKRSHAVVVTRSELAEPAALEKLMDEIHDYSGHNIIFPSRFAHQLFTWKETKADLSSILRNAKVLALSAVGNPQSFEENLRSYGAEVVPLRFPDHYPYTDRDLEQIGKRAQQESALIVTTEKDEVKLRQTRWGHSTEVPSDLFILRGDLLFSSEDEVKWRKKLNDLKIT